MFIRKFKAVFPTYIFLLILVSWNCTKIDTTNLGANLIPVVDNIHTFDTTLDVTATNFDPFDCDSVYVTDLHALGIIPDDPNFGKTSANIYCQLKPQNYPFNFPASDPGTLLVDSVVLILHYSHTYGDTLLPQKVQVYEITDPFQADTTYTTCHLFSYNSANLLGDQTYVPARLVDSVHGFNEASNNQLRIRLLNSFAERFITDSAGIFHNDTLFTAGFKGFAIVPDTLFGGNAINYFDLTNTDTRLAFYFRTTLAGVKDTSIINFTFNSLSGESNAVIRNRGASEITSHLSNPIGGDSLIYIQTAPGSYAELRIPGLTGLSNRVIHRAELIVDQAYSPFPSDVFLTTPNYLYLDTKDTSGTTYIPIPCDFSVTNGQGNFSYFGGPKKIISDGSGHSISQYVFNISRYVQSIATKASNNAVLRLRAPYNIVNQATYADKCNQLVSPFNFQLNNIAEGAVKLNGSNKTATRLRLHIIYSTL